MDTVHAIGYQVSYLVRRILYARFKQLLRLVFIKTYHLGEIVRQAGSAESHRPLYLPGVDDRHYPRRYRRIYPQHPGLTDEFIEELVVKKQL